MGGILLVGLVVAFRPVARTGAVAYAQSNLRRAAEAAEDLAAEGTLGDATRQRLGLDGELDDLLLIDPDQSSNDSEVVSVLATGGSWTGCARAETGECFWIRVAEVPAARSGPSSAPGPTARRRRRASPARGWPEP